MGEDAPSEQQLFNWYSKHGFRCRTELRLLDRVNRSREEKKWARKIDIDGRAKPAPCLRKRPATDRLMDDVQGADGRT